MESMSQTKKETRIVATKSITHFWSSELNVITLHNVRLAIKFWIHLQFSISVYKTNAPNKKHQNAFPECKFKKETQEITYRKVIKNAKEILIYQAKYTMHNIENMNYDAIINSVIMTFTNEADI